MRVRNLLLILLVVLLAALPLWLQRGAEFGGADGLAEEAIGELRPGYEPWFKTLWEPPSGEVESLLFALQAALGAGFIGYYLGYGKGKKEASSAERGSAPDEKSLDAFRRS